MSKYYQPGSGLPGSLRVCHPHPEAQASETGRLGFPSFQVLSLLLGVHWELIVSLSLGCPCMVRRVDSTIPKLHSRSPTFSEHRYQALC
jgi:hypothetical protein